MSITLNNSFDPIRLRSETESNDVIVGRKDVTVIRQEISLTERRESKNFKIQISEIKLLVKGVSNDEESNSRNLLKFVDYLV